MKIFGDGPMALRESGEVGVTIRGENCLPAFSPGFFKGIGDDALSQR